jgi:hypothetical protein
LAYFDYRSRDIVVVILMFRRSIDVFRRTVAKQAYSAKSRINTLTCPHPLVMDSFDVSNYTTPTYPVLTGVYSTSRAAFANMVVDGKLSAWTLIFIQLLSTLTPSTNLIYSNFTCRCI